MNIFSFSRMKSYRQDGKVRVILKLKLPRSGGESEVFDGFYERLADEYASLAVEAPYSTDVGTRPTTVSIDYSVITEEYMTSNPKTLKKHGNSIVIKRKTSINVNGKIRSYEYVDLYDTDSCLFVK